MTREETSDRLCEMLIQSRHDAKKSQEWVAKKLGVSKKSVQNWESGLSSPNILMTFEWFNAIGVPMYPYFMSVLHPLEIDGIGKNCEEERLRKALGVYIKEMPERYIRELLFLFLGNHGSCPSGVTELVTAYLHLPLSFRVSIAQMIATNYEICDANNLLKCEEHIKPDWQTISIYAESAKNAVKDGKDSYLNIQQ